MGRWGTSGEPRFHLSQKRSRQLGHPAAGIFSPNGKYLAAATQHVGAHALFLNRGSGMSASGRATVGATSRTIERAGPKDSLLHFRPTARRWQFRWTNKCICAMSDAGTMSGDAWRAFGCTAWSVAYSPDGPWRAVGTLDSSLRLVDPRNPSGWQRAWSAPAASRMHSRSRPMVAPWLSGSGAGEVTLWDVETGEEMLTLEGPTGSVWCLAFSPDGTRLAANSELPDGRSAVYIWHAPRLPASDAQLTRGRRSGQNPRRTSTTCPVCTTAHSTP